jgi:predicted MPP superfamily phosphohydrolase
VLKAERADLVALTGDIVSGAAAHDPCRAWDEVARIIEAHGTPWAAVFGNHDDEGAASRAQMLRAQRRHPLCLSER